MNKGNVGACLAGRQAGCSAGREGRGLSSSTLGKGTKVRRVLQAYHPQRKTRGTGSSLASTRRQTKGPKTDRPLLIRCATSRIDERKAAHYATPGSAGILPATWQRRCQRIGFYLTTGPLPAGLASPFLAVPRRAAEINDWVLSGH